MGSHSVTCHPAEVTFPPLPQPKPVLDSATPEGCKAELTQLAGYIPRWYTRPKTVTHPGTDRARRALTSFMRRTPLTTAPRGYARWFAGAATQRAGRHLAWRRRGAAGGVTSAPRTMTSARWRRSWRRSGQPAGGRRPLGHAAAVRPPPSA